MKLIIIFSLYMLLNGLGQSTLYKPLSYEGEEIWIWFVYGQTKKQMMWTGDENAWLKKDWLKYQCQEFKM